VQAARDGPSLAGATVTAYLANGTTALSDAYYTFFTAAQVPADNSDTFLPEYLMAVGTDFVFFEYNPYHVAGYTGGKYSDTGFVGAVLAVEGNTAPIIGAALDLEYAPNSSWQHAVVTSDATHVYINLAGLTYAYGDQVYVTLTFGSPAGLGGTE
jgi:hypothetical protein